MTMSTGTQRDVVYVTRRELTEADRLDAEIQRTRTELAHTVGALQETLRPERLLNEARDAAREKATSLAEDARGVVRDATVGKVERTMHEVTEQARETRSGLMATVRQHPMAAGLAAVSLGWLWMHRSGSSGTHARGAWDYHRSAYAGAGYTGSSYVTAQSMGSDGGGMSARVGGAVDGTRETAQRIAGRATDSVATARDTAVDAAGAVANRATEAASAAGEMASTVGERASEMAGDVSQQAVEVARAAQDRAQMAQTDFGRMLESNPLAVGAAAVGVGVAIGLLLPATNRENELLGRTRDQLMDRAVDTLQSTGEQLQRVGREAGHAAQREAKAQNLTA